MRQAWPSKKKNNEMNTFADSYRVTRNASRMARMVVFVLLGLLSACHPEVGIDIPAYGPKLVVDGYIEQDKYAYVALTKSAGFFDDINEEDLKRASVITAKVIVSDGEQEEVLTLKKNKNGFPPLAYYGTEIRGEVGKAYYLTVVFENNNYTASTKILPPPKFDSLWYENYDGSPDKFLLKGRFRDDPHQENYYRIFTQRKNIDNKPIPTYLSATGDKYFNGKEFTIDILRGTENFTDIGNDTYFEKDDTVLVRFCSMDQFHFDFWRTLEQEIYSAANPFSSSGNSIKHNINGGAIGIWGGYGAGYDIVTISN